MDIRLKFLCLIKRVLRNLGFYWLVCFAIIMSLVVVLNRHYDYEEKDFSRPFSREIEEMINQQRLEIEKEMDGYPYDALSGRNISGLSDLAMELGGNPMRSVIVTTWRSGSTLLGELLSTHPASYYTFEPLMELGTFRTPLSSSRPLTILDSVFKCNFSNLGDFLEIRKNDVFHYDYNNKYLKKQCLESESLCHESEFSTKHCRLFPFQVVKIVGLDLASMSSFLDDKNLGIKIVFLVRDPRAVMNSRYPLDWCKIDPNCNNPATLCSNMVSDYSTAMDFSKRYPDTFKVLRYEDFATKPLKLGRDIYSFYGLHYHDDVKKFLNTHMNVTRGDAYSTFRNAKSVPFQWKENLTFDEVDKIQAICGEAMNIWGYNLALNHHHQRRFDPVRPLSSYININYFG